MRRQSTFFLFIPRRIFGHLRHPSRGNEVFFCLDCLFFFFWAGYDVHMYISPFPAAIRWLGSIVYLGTGDGGGGNKFYIVNIFFSLHMGLFFFQACVVTVGLDNVR
jgi:hypothetical protein